MSDLAKMRAAEFAARDKFGRLVAYLASRFGSFAEAEDALSSALTSAIEQWAKSGIPDNPSAWLLTVARRRMADDARRGNVASRGADHLKLLADEVEEDAMSKQTQDKSELHDPRVELMFVCAHPAIDRAAQAPLMLQTVLGLKADVIASAFVISPNTMGQRLARAKNRIKEAGIAFVKPDRDVYEDRKEAVLDAIYACFTCGHGATADSGKQSDLTNEAIWLAEIAEQIFPNDPEVMGLLALKLFISARQSALYDDGEWTPLHEQDTTQWNVEKISRAETLLKRASVFASPGRYQLEAAIQSVHSDRLRTGKTEWTAIVGLHEVLQQLAPTLGSNVAFAAALHMDGRSQQAADLLDTLPRSTARSYQPYWVVKAEASRTLGDHVTAFEAFCIAIGLTSDPKVRKYLTSRKALLEN